MISAIAAAHCTVTLMVAGLCAWLCLAGIVLGIFSAFWGYLALRSKKTALGAIAMLAGIVLGVAAPSMIVWWVAGGWNDASSRQEMASLAQSMQEYTHKTGYYPPTKFADGSGPKDGPTASKTLAQMYLPAPSASPEGSGGDYIYLPSSPLIRSSTIINCPLLAWPAPQIPFTGGDAGTLLLAEKEQNHRRFRMCMTTDLVARELTPRQFDALLALPQNMEFYNAVNAKIPDKLQEEPNRRINLGFAVLSPRQTLHAAIATIAIFGLICIVFITRATLKARKE
jgi:hypothetical protein